MNKDARVIDKSICKYQQQIEKAPDQKLPPPVYIQSAESSRLGGETAATGNIYHRVMPEAGISKAKTMERMPAACMISLPVLPKRIYPGKRYQNKISVAASIPIAVSTIGLAVLGCPLSASLFSRLHQ